MSETRRPLRDLSHLVGADLETIVRYNEALRSHPFTKAQETIREFVNQCVTDPNFVQSPGLLDMMLVVRDVLGDGATDEWNIEDYLSPIEQATRERIKERESEQNSKNASNDRLGARDPMKARIVDIMKMQKNSGMVFSDFLSAWKRDPQGRLILKTINPHDKQDKQRFEVTDDAPAAPGKRPLPKKTYAVSTLRDYWNKS